MLHLNELDKCRGSEYEFIKAVGVKNGPLETSLIDTDSPTGFGLHKLVIPNMGSKNSIGNIKIAKQNQVGGHSVVFLTGASEKEIIQLKKYLESIFVQFLIQSFKITTPNSKTLFSYLPEIDLTKTWTDAEIYQHFNLTPEEIEYIENNVK